MTTSVAVSRAVRNNASWCDATSRAHGAAGEFHAGYWIHRGAVPLYTSKLITLAGPTHSASQLAAIEALMRAEPESCFSVKDAFQCLELAPLGFEVLFKATWIQWTPGVAPCRDQTEQLQWSVVRNADALLEWEQAWRGSPANAAARDAPRAFPISLLTEPGFHFLAGRCGDDVVACGALNFTGEVVGLSNVFTGIVDVGPLYPGCVRLTQQLYPGVPVVGYERGGDLLAAKEAGFEPVHDLTVWQRSSRPA